MIPFNTSFKDIFFLKLVETLELFALNVFTSDSVGSQERIEMR